MVTRYGMSSIGPIALEDNNNEQMFLGGEYNEAIADRMTLKFAKLSIIVNKSRLKLF
jgi:ATP-dependent Zn protease